MAEVMKRIVNELNKNPKLGDLLMLYLTCKWLIEHPNFIADSETVDLALEMREIITRFESRFQ